MKLIIRHEGPGTLFPVDHGDEPHREQQKVVFPANAGMGGALFRNAFSSLHVVGGTIGKRI